MRLSHDDQPMNEEIQELQWIPPGDAVILNIPKRIQLYPGDVVRFSPAKNRYRLGEIEWQDKSALGLLYYRQTVLYPLNKEGDEDTFVFCGEK